MMRLLRSHQGFTLVELLVGSMLAGLVVYFAASIIAATKANNLSRIDRIDGKNELATVSQLIKRQGRTATSCTRSGTVAASTLTCTGTFYNGVVDTYRFIIVNGALEHQKQVSGNWVMQSRYLSITNLEVCGKDEMLSNGAGCSLMPGFLSLAPDVVRDDRFFRFRLVSRLDISNPNSATSSIQSAFYVRNPSELGNQVTYQMGF